MSAEPTLDLTPAVGLLRQAIETLAIGLRPDGELEDPVFHDPTQYGTPYFAYCNAVLASISAGEDRDRYLERAQRGLRATLGHLHGAEDPDPAVADYTHGVGSPGFRNLRDFMWPPVLRTYRLLRDLGASELPALAEQISAVDVPAIFSEKPPVNWAAVWILGEWERIQEGLSPYSAEQIDEWLAPFFMENPDSDHGFYRELREATGADVTWDTAIDLERGFYREPGVPNSYDLWARVHLLELLVEGYDGRFAPQMRQLVSSGLKRSLGVQLSTGSLASAYRSTAHLWNLTGQVWFFHHAAHIVSVEDPELAERARVAANRAFGAAQACLRPTGDLSPVENVLPAAWRVGYEVYTMEAHYVSLPLGYLANAVVDGFDGVGLVADHPETRVHIEDEPVYRSLVHGRGWSVHVNLAPFEGYDPLGIADLTSGFGNRLRFGGQAHYGRADASPDLHRLTLQMPITLGVAVRREDRSIHPVSAMRPTGDRGFEARVDGFRGFADVDVERYEVDVRIDGDDVEIVEAFGEDPRSLLIPYLRDRGDGLETQVVVQDRVVVLTSGEERIEVVVTDHVEKTVHLPFGYESRHGLVGLLRLDLSGRGPVSYRVRRG